MAHPQHPNCPDCGKALFKSPVAAKVKPADPYAYCRNKACKQYTFRTLGVDFDPKKSAVKASLGQAMKVGARATKLVQKDTPSPPAAPEKAPQPETKPTSKRGRKRAALPSSEAPKRPTEPEPIAKARQRLKDILAEVVKGHPREAAGLVLAILSQETGNQRAAETLIDEYKLDVKFGLQKFQDHHG